MKKKKILIVDDQERNIKILSFHCKKQGHEICEARNGREAIDIAKKELPDAILMDVMMPEMDGLAATERLKSDPATKHIPIIMVTALDSREDRLAGIQKGADDFLTKPVDSDELILRLKNNLRNKEFHDFLQDHAKILEQQVKKRTEQLYSGYIDTIYRLTLASEYKDEDTGAHIKRISHYTRELSAALGMPSEFTDTMQNASSMHDIGKVSIPDAVLLKKGPLDNDEWVVMKTHTTIGANILQGSESPLLQVAVDIALSHHERWDGKGYPRELAGEEIPLTARIMNICDQYDALRSKRPYKAAFDQEKTVKIIIDGDGRTMPEHFDPEILAAFKKTTDIFEDIFLAHKDDNDAWLN